MPQLVKVSVSRQRPPVGLVARVRHALRAYWTKPFTLKDPALNAFFGYGSRSKAGPLVNELTMFTCAAFFDGVTQIASDIAKLPLNLKKRRQEGGTDDYIGSKAYRLMKYSPNPETGSMVFRRTLTLHALTSKGGFAEIERDGVGRPAALWILEPHRVKPFYDIGHVGPDGRKDPLRYLVDNTEVFEASDILHLQGPGWDGVVGFEMVQIAREAIGLALASQEFASAFFGNQARFGGILMSDEDLDEDQENDLRRKIEELHARADKAFRLLVLGAGFKYQQTGVNPSEAQMKEIRDQQVLEVARFLNMPPHKLKLNQPGAVSYASVEMANLDYHVGTLLNWQVLWEEELNRKLIPPLEQGLQYFKHNTNAFLRGDIKSRYDALGIARDKGIINADEWRELEDLNPQPDGQGKAYLVQQAMIPADKLGELVASQIAKNKAAAKKATEPPKPPPPPPTNGNGDSDPEEPDDRQQLRERLAAAEALLADARQAETLARESLAALEATHGATKAELERQRGLVAEAVGRRTEFELVAEFVRGKAAALEARAEELAALVAREQAARELAERAVTEAQAAAQQATTERDEQIAALERARQEAVEARTATEAATAALDEATRRAESADGDRASADQARATAIAALDAAEARQREAEAARVVAEQAMAAAASRAEEATAAAEARVADLEALLQQAGIDRDTQAARAAGAEDAAIAARASHEALQATHAALEAQLAEEASRRAALEAQLAEQRERERERLLSVIAAHRGLFVDAFGRMTRRECEQARRKQATPEKLRRWLLGFPTLHEAICTEAVLPVMRTYLAWKGSAEDPLAKTSTVVQEHIGAFVSQIRQVLDADPEDFQVLLDRALTRWEADRAGAVADAMLAEEIRHVQTR